MGLQTPQRCVHYAAPTATPEAASLTFQAALLLSISPLFSPEDVASSLYPDPPLILLFCSSSHLPVPKLT